MALIEHCYTKHSDLVACSTEQVFEPCQRLVRSNPQNADYAWEIATLYPEQGEWSEEEYLVSPMARSTGLN